MEIVYICDNSVEGLLSSIYRSYYSGDNVVDIITGSYQQSDFMCNYDYIETDYDNAQKVSYAIKKKISNLTFNNAVNTWLSELPRRGYHILKYIELGFKKGNNVNFMLTHDNVDFVLKTNRKVELEVHRFLGILRFSEMQDGTLFSEIAPDHNILPLMGEHFAARLGTEKLIIYDKKRKNAILSDRGEWIIANDIQMKNISYSSREYSFRSMWQRYFECIAISERKNKKLQRSFIPVRYWENVTELKKELK
ncbi:MAG: TIGR03915 family putative DNA repair protein [Eubacteriales bacterium]